MRGPLLESRRDGRKSVNLLQSSHVSINEGIGLGVSPGTVCCQNKGMLLAMIVSLIGSISSQMKCRRMG